MALSNRELHARNDDDDRSGFRFHKQRPIISVFIIITVTKISLHTRSVDEPRQRA